MSGNGGGEKFVGLGARLVGRITREGSKEGKVP